MSGRITHYKIVLLGDTAVGKSCLVVRFVRNEFSETEQVLPPLQMKTSFLIHAFVSFLEFLFTLLKISYFVLSYPTLNPKCDLNIAYYRCCLSNTNCTC